jgi:hypothetical protein
VDPLRLVQQIPAGMAIPRLRDRLVNIIADFRTQTQLRQGCNTILCHDCIALAQVGAWESTAMCGRLVGGGVLKRCLRNGWTPPLP